MVKRNILKIFLVFMLLMIQGCLQKVEPSPETNSPGYVKVDKKTVEDTTKVIGAVVLLIGLLYITLVLDSDDENTNHGV